MTGKILIVDDVATNRIVLKVKLAAARYQTLQAGSGAEALRVIANETPDLILLEARLPDANGYEICRKLRTLPATADVPIILTATDASPSARLAALRAGANDMLPKPVDEQDLFARLRGLLRARAEDLDLGIRESAFHELGLAEAAADYAPPATVALVAGSRETALSWKNALTRYLPGDVLTVLLRDEALAEAAGKRCPDAFLIAADLAHPGEGLRLMSDLRARAQSRHAAICIAVAGNGTDTAAAAYDLGADDLIVGEHPTPALAEEAALRLRRQIERKRRSDRQRRSLTNGLRLAMTDPLTGLHNRRYAMPQLLRMAENARDAGHPIAVMVLDLDRFKSINDTWGHGTGDTVLVEVARRLRRCLSPSDLLARIGGEEFLIGMPNVDLRDARRAAEHICCVIGNSPIPIPEIGRSLSVTVSIGLALGTNGSAPVDLLINQADHALLGSKAEGRNQVKVFCRSAA